MFYSHTFLARKSPLGTVWMAAHLQHKLRKSHVSLTDISSTVDSIMCPEVPIALRLSAFLLLGVVRIYSKKVEYLYYDCNEVLTHIRTAFASIQDVNLPEDAASAPFHSVTLPETFELDALNIDDELYFERTSDNHLKTYEEITMTDQIPGSQDPYVAFFINEVKHFSFCVPLARENSGVGVSDVSPSNQAGELNQTVPEDRLPQEIPETEAIRDADHNLESGNLQELLDLGKDSVETEVIRDAVHNLEANNLQELLDHGKDSNEQERPLEQTENENEKEKLSPIMEDALVSGGQSASFQLLSDPPTTIVSGGSFGNFDSHISLGHESLEMAIQPTPQVEKEKPKSRKRKQFFDMSVVLSNRVIKEGLKNASKLVCKRRKLPCSALDVWKFNNRKRMDQIFCESSISGLSINLQNIIKKEYVSSKVHQEHTLQELKNASSHPPVPDVDVETEHLQPDVVMETQHLRPDVDLETEHLQPDVDMETEHLRSDVDTEIEHLRFNEVPAEGDFLTEFMASPSRRDEFTPFPARNSGSEPQTGNTFETEPLPSREQTTPAEPVGFFKETPLIFSEQQQGLDETGFSDIPTLAVAQYLKNQSPATEISKDEVGNLTLNKILQGKTRKQCARMFFETLVLTSYDLIKVQQEEAYGDITLLITSLSKTQL
ncbi:Rad21/Rec8-like protein [Macleaya cordata]|uniref:Rad21/Rec8-like protein n=1 Tax=Macleaya cordata TaxID=56857 RepID=A0A200Q840_MACCD|nr:Rad21/Rec8-like protein [Macleaya cordata]